MKILLINLAEETRRRVFQSAQFARLGLTFERLEAVTIADIDEADYQTAAYDWERPLSRAEYACYLSHRSAWLQILEHREPVLVLEDDAYLSDGVPELLPALADLDEVDLVTLEARGRKKLLGRKARPLVGDYQLRRLYQDRSGAAGYLLWPQGAHKLLALERRRGAALADAQICRAYSLRSFQVEPAPLIQLDCCELYGLTPPMITQSAILNSRRQTPPSLSAAIQVRCKLRRLRAQLRMARRQAVRSLQAVRRPVRVDTGRFMGNIKSTPDSTERC